MTALIKTDIAIIGAGVIGLATALRLAAAGREVVVIDPNEPGSGASYGNAGVVAPYGCAPIGNPDTLRNLPSLLFDPESPLAIRPAALPALLGCRASLGNPCQRPRTVMVARWRAC